MKIFTITYLEYTFLHTHFNYWITISYMSMQNVYLLNALNNILGKYTYLQHTEEIF